MKRDYYEVLGIPKGSSAAEIKRAYKTLAKTHHPDVAKDENKTAAEQRFKEINEAYQVLSDSQKKKVYDQFGHAGMGGAGPFGAGQNQSGRWGPFTYTYTTGGSGAGVDFGGFSDPLDIFEEVFGFRGFGRQPRRGRNTYYQLVVDFMAAVKGLEQEISLNGRKLKVRIPAGVNDGTELRFVGKGADGPSGTPPGDLFLTIRVKSHPRLARFGADILSPEEISFAQAALGDTIRVSVLAPEAKNGLKEVKLKIPPGTQPGTRFRIRGEGMPRLRGRGRGDHYVQVRVTIPQRLTRQQRKILEEYRQVTGF